MRTIKFTHSKTFYSNTHGNAYIENDFFYFERIHCALKFSETRDVCSSELNSR